MGILNVFRSSLEKRLIADQTKLLLLVGLSEAQANEIADLILKKAKEDVKGFPEFPENFGDIFFHNLDDKCSTQFKDTLNNIRQDFPLKQIEGVKDVDVQWWWNLTSLEKAFLLQTDEFSKTAFFTDRLKQGLEPEDAAKEMNKVFPNFYFGFASKHPKKNEDSPLPAELKNRIINYSTSRLADDLDSYKKEMNANSSYNALIRNEIRAGRIR